MEFLIGLCLISMVSIAIVAVVKLCVLDRAERLNYLKSYKKGKFALIYLVAIPLYWLGIAHNGTPIGGAFLLAIKSAVELVVLKYDYNSVSLLMEENFFFRITIDICFILVALNAILFTMTLFGQSIGNWIRKIKATKLSKKVYVVVGFNAQNKMIIESINQKDCSIILLANYLPETADYAFINKVALVKCLNDESLTTKLTVLFKTFTEKTVNVILNTGNDATNLVYTEQISTVICQMDLGKYSIDDNRGLNAYVFGEPENVSAFYHFVEKTNGCIHLINKYKLIAMDFVGKYPLTEYLNASQIDYDTATVCNDVSLNVLMIGFGKTNQQIFLTSVANNQFLTFENGDLKEKPVNYWIYDKKDSRNDKNLNHNYYRYSNEIYGKTDEYLPLPPKPANEKFFELDINDKSFYDSIKNNLKNDVAKRSFSYIIIAFGSDMENLDLAEKIVAKIKEWGLFQQTKVFVKIRDNRLAVDVINKEYASESGFFTFGNEKDTVFNLSQIVNEQKEMMARNRHLSYSLKNGLCPDDEERAKQKANNSWYKQEQVRRESNIYACLSIRMKLHLLGFDYEAINSNKNSANEQYQSVYEKGDHIVYDDSTKEVKGKRNIVYCNDVVQGSVRQILAIQEHQRWNAYMITCGVIPSTIKQIENGDSKNLKLRRHGNITTFDGLVKFRQIEAARTKSSEETTDVIRWDYQLMDDLVWLLTNNGYKIVKR